MQLMIPGPALPSGTAPSLASPALLQQGSGKHQIHALIRTLLSAGSRRLDWSDTSVQPLTFSYLELIYTVYLQHHKIVKNLTHHPFIWPILGGSVVISTKVPISPRRFQHHISPHRNRRAGVLQRTRFSPPPPSSYTAARQGTSGPQPVPCPRLTSNIFLGFRRWGTDSR